MKLLLKSVAVLSLASVLPVLSSAQHYTQKNLVSDLPQPNNADGSPVVLDPRQPHRFHPG